MSVFWIGEPRRHRSGGDGCFDRLCPRSYLLLTEHRERANLTGSMATLEILLQDGKYILAVRNGRFRLFDRRRHSWHRSSNKQYAERRYGNATPATHKCDLPFLSSYQNEYFNANCII